MKQPATYYHVKSTDKRIQVHQGGTRSGKTFSIVTCIIELCRKNRNRGLIVTICRKTFPSLRASVMRDFFNILNREDIYNVGLHNKSEATYRLDGNLIEFLSVDQAEKVRGRKRDLLFINEANQLHREDWRQLLLRTTGRVIIDYNPSDQYHWIYDDVLNREDVAFFQTTYKDNPYLEKSVVDEIERFKHTDLNYWRIYGLGERGINTAAIFTTWETIEAIPPRAKLVGYGCDWGFTNDPTAIVSVWQIDFDLYIREHVYQSGLTNIDISEKITGLEIGRHPIICDSAEPKSIEELHRRGHNVKPAKKGPDSVRLGIDIMKRHRLFITDDSPNAIKEFQNYKWETDKDDKQLSKPVDKNNHIIDAVRYVCINRIGTSYSGKYYIS